MVETQRLEWLDNVKVFGMILVYIGHCNIPGVNPYIYLFHMPLFFIISGFLWNTEKNANIPLASFAKKKYKSYIIPYFKICAVCFVLFRLPLGICKIGLSFDLVNYYSRYLWGILVYSRGTTDWLPHCSPVWYLTCLFCSEVMFYVIMKSKKPFFYVVLVGCMGYVTTQIGKYFPWNIDSAFSAVPLLYVGVLIRYYWDYLSSERSLLIWLPLAICIELYGIKGVDFDGNNFNNMIVMYVQSILVTTALLVLFYTFLRYNGGGMFAQNTIILIGYNYAINSVISRIPGFQNNWLMAIGVVIVGALFVIVLNDKQKIKQYLV